MKILLFAALLFFTSCKDKVTVQDVLIIDSSNYNADPPPHFNVHNENQNQLMGVWIEGSTKNATFSIDNDSIFYVEDNLMVPYHLSGDSIKIIFPTHTYNGQFAFEKDTLVLIDAYGSSKYWPFRN